MKIVIDILDEDYKRIKDMPDAFNSLTSRAYKSIKNGTPLPEGHDRLIDVDRLMRVDHIILESQVDNAPTIIEATEEDEE